ncbi:hypothetical protein [Nocardia sp. NPDC058705]|uniref:hypothetical protein n=1 Tax=Nocardia sp. NPDC058705 TaxID=3346609 RepID=UPI0036983E09
MNATRETPAERTPIEFLLLALVCKLGRIIAAAGLTPAEFEPIAGIRHGRLVAGLARPERLTLNVVFRVVQAADIDWLDFWDRVEDGARSIAAHVSRGTACRLCGRAFGVDSLSRPDGFGDHGQLFRCSDTWGCSVDDDRDDEPVMVPRTGDRFAIRTELPDGSTGYEPVTVISVGANVLVDGVEDTESVALFELEPIELADRPSVDPASVVVRAIEQGKPASDVLAETLADEEYRRAAGVLAFVEDHNHAVAEYDARQLDAAPLAEGDR